MRKSKYTINEKYFAKPSILNSYWAGFLAADGCITNKTLKINLSDKDKKHLEKFKDCVKFTGKIYNYHNNHNNRKATIHIHNKIFISYLENIFNIHERKTFNLQKPNIKLNKKQELAYLIGYIDADGCIYNSGRKKQTISISIVGASPHILKFLSSILKKYNINLSVTNTTNGYFRLCVNGKRAEKLYNLLLNLNVPRLKRKWEWPKFKEKFK